MGVAPRPTPAVRRLLGFAAALLIIGALVTPVVLTGPSGSPTAHCEPSLLYEQHVYDRRTAANAATRQGIATGIGVLRGCGRAPSNVNVRSVVGIDPGRAVAIEGDPDLYARAGLCAHTANARLVRCLRR